MEWMRLLPVTRVTKSSLRSCWSKEQSAQWFKRGIVIGIDLDLWVNLSTYVVEEQRETKTAKDGTLLNFRPCQSSLGSCRFRQYISSSFLVWLAGWLGCLQFANLRWGSSHRICGWWKSAYVLQVFFLICSKDRPFLVVIRQFRSAHFSR